MSSVELQSVSKIYSSKNKSTLAVDRVSFEVKDRSITVLVGPSGCGKTSILRMIAGLENITEGNIRIDGQVMNDIPSKDRHIAMVFQNYALYPHMTVFDNMAFGLKIQKTPKDVIKKRVSDAADLLQLIPYLDHKPRELSGGQRQRVAVGRAIVRRPKVLLFDEPLSNLDAKLRVEMRMELMRMQKELGWTVIYVTHDQQEAMTMADSMVLLSGGTIQQIGSAMDMYANPSNKFVAEFIGTPPMNFFESEIITGDRPEILISGQRIILKNQTPLGNRKRVVAGIRPEHLDMQEEMSTFTGLTAELEFIEQLGNENLYYFKVGSQRVACRKPTDSIPHRVGQRFFLHMDPDKVHLFDIENGRRI